MTLCFNLLLESLLRRRGALGVNHSASPLDGEHLLKIFFPIGMELERDRGKRHT